jgi:ribonuclease D
LELPPPILVEDGRSLEQLLERLEGVAELALDTEADSFFSYREKVCLVQITCDGDDFLVDPLSGLDLRPLGPVFADPRRIKVLHDSEFDVLLLKRQFGFQFAGLFDTRVAAAALGREGLGLAAVLQQEFGVRLDKSQQLSDWGRRPLTRQQIGYARLDTHHLLALRERLAQQLEAAERTEVARTEFERLARIEPPPRRFDPDEYLRLKGARNLDLRAQSVLRELFVTREQLAEARNVPPFKVLAHGALVELAQRAPRTERGLAEATGIRSQAIARIAGPLLGAIERGLAQGPLPRPPQLAPKDGTLGFDEFDHELHDRLKACRKAYAESQRIEAALALNRLTLLELVRRRPRTRGELEQVPGLHRWQIEGFGDRLLETIARFERDRAEGRFQPQARRRRR